MDKADLMQFLRDNTPAKQFVPYCHFSKEADALTVYFEGDPDYSKRVNDHVTVYLSLETHEVVGCRIKGVSELIEDLPNYININIKEAKVKLSILFLAFRGGIDDRNVAEQMNELARAATKKNMVFEPCI